MVKRSRQHAKFKALLAERAHFMRHNATEEESILWCCLAGNRLGASFRRQFVIGRYIVDLVAAASRIVESHLDLKALVIEAHNIERLLRHLGEPLEPPKCSPARDPPYFKSQVLRRKLGELN